MRNNLRVWKMLKIDRLMQIDEAGSQVSPYFVGVERGRLSVYVEVDTDGLRRCNVSIQAVTYGLPLWR